jgi:hypothetical protein
MRIVVFRSYGQPTGRDAWIRETVINLCTAQAYLLESPTSF